MFKQIFEMFKSDSLYEQALSECHEMLEIDREMFNESIKALRSSDSPDIPIDIYAMDKKINSFERDVRRKVMTHLAISGSKDLGSGLILTSVVIDFERIEEISEVSQSIVEDIISGKDNNINAAQAASISLYSRYLKRIAAHSRNLISSIVNPFERIGYPE